MKTIATRPKIGVFVDNLGPTQFSYFLLKEAHLLQAKYDVSIFQVQAVKPCIQAHCGIFNIGDGYSFDGIAVSTNLFTTSILNECLGPKAKYFYPWDLEWVRHDRRDYETLLSLYKAMPVIARSDYHANYLRNLWDCDIIKVHDNFNWFSDKDLINYANK